MLAALAKRLSLEFDQGFDLGLGVKPDAIDPRNRVVVEVYARVGPLKGAQLHKVKGDILKLAYIDNKLGTGWRKIICFASEEAASYLMGHAWAASAARCFQIEVCIEPLSQEHAQAVVAAQKRQRMVNPE